MKTQIHTNESSQIASDIALLIAEACAEVTKNAVHGDKLMNIDEAAKYTGRSRRTFQRECKRGTWTCIKVLDGHPKFRKSDLDKDLAAWTTIGKIRKAA